MLRAPLCFAQRGAARALVARAPVGSVRHTSTFANEGQPLVYLTSTKSPEWDHRLSLEFETMPRDEFGVPGHIPPDVHNEIDFVYAVPPQHFPFLKKLGDETASLKPYMDKLIAGELTRHDFEKMFYEHAEPLQVHRSELPLPLRTEAEMKRSDEVMWQSKWLNFRMRVQNIFRTEMGHRSWVYCYMYGFMAGLLWLDLVVQYRADMKLFYLESPELKINWVIPRGDL